MEIKLIEAYGRLGEIRTLFSEYTGWLNIDLSFQHYGDELAGLPGKYARPDGRLYLAAAGEGVAGCVALRRFDDTRCEMKRLYVRPAYRGMGIGGTLAKRVIGDARACGYREMLLDTLSSMKGAVALYRSLGFEEIPPYYLNPMGGALYMRLPL